MAQLALIFFAGLLGSSHCIGMCGPLALALGVQETPAAANFRRQLLFSCGRITTYGFLGALAGAGGWWLSQRPQAIVNVQATLSIVAGVSLVLLGLSSAGMLPPVAHRWLTGAPCTVVRHFKTLLTAPGIATALVAGVFTGFIPCGLVYAFVVYAATTGSIVGGWATMVAFGLGTMPLMVLAGCGGTLLSLQTRVRVLQIAAWCVVLTGVLSIARGAGYLQLTANASQGSCPFCN